MPRTEGASGVGSLPEAPMDPGRPDVDPGANPGLLGASRCSSSLTGAGPVLGPRQHAEGGWPLEGLLLVVTRVPI